MQDFDASRRDRRNAPVPEQVLARTGVSVMGIAPVEMTCFWCGKHINSIWTLYQVIEGKDVPLHSNGKCNKHLRREYVEKLQQMTEQAFFEEIARHRITIRTRIVKLVKRLRLIPTDILAGITAAGVFLMFWHGSYAGGITGGILVSIATYLSHQSK